MKRNIQTIYPLTLPLCGAKRRVLVDAKSTQHVRFSHSMPFSLHLALVFLFSIFSRCVCVYLAIARWCNRVLTCTMQTTMSQFMFFSMHSYSSVLSSSWSLLLLLYRLSTKVAWYFVWHTYLFVVCAFFFASPFNLPEQTCRDRRQCARTNGKTRLHMFQYSCYVACFLFFALSFSLSMSNLLIYIFECTQTLLNYKKKKRFICLHYLNYLRNALATNGACERVCVCVYSYFTHQIVGHRQNENKQEQKPALQ